MKCPEGHECWKRWMVEVLNVGSSECPEMWDVEEKFEARLEMRSWKCWMLKVLDVEERVGIKLKAKCRKGCPEGDVERVISEMKCRCWTGRRCWKRKVGMDVSEVGLDGVSEVECPEENAGS